MNAESIGQMIDAARREVDQVDPFELASRLEQVVILDVRENRELLEGFVPGATNIPRGVLEFGAEKHPRLSVFDREIVVYSNRGERSLLAARTLHQLGYSRVSSLAGGMDRWLECDLPVA